MARTWCGWRRSATSSTWPVRRGRVDRMNSKLLALATCVAFFHAGTSAAMDKVIDAQSSPEKNTMNSEPALTSKQQAIAPITAATATGDMPQLNAALNRGLDAGLSISNAKEVLVQMYAYTGFPRSLN